ncbi:MAG: hypothetical protein WBG95_08975 [Sulfitobacter sp.]
MKENKMSTKAENNPNKATKPTNAALAYWTEGQVANRLGVSVQWLRLERARGSSLRFRRFGRSIKYKISDVLEYEEKAVVNFTGENPKGMVDERDA